MLGSDLSPDQVERLSSMCHCVVQGNCCRFGLVRDWDESRGCGASVATWFLAKVSSELRSLCGAWKRLLPWPSV